jgi:hypothetical protein
MNKTHKKWYCLQVFDQPTLAPHLEAIKQVMVEKQNEKLKAKSKATAACPDARSSPKRNASWGLSD